MYWDMPIVIVSFSNDFKQFQTKAAKLCRLCFCPPDVDELYAPHFGVAAFIIKQRHSKLTVFRYRASKNAAFIYACRRCIRHGL